MRKTLISIAIVSLLSACGGSSSDDNTNATTPPVTVPVTPPVTPPVTATAYRVIDGYLNAADVCVIAEGKSDCVSIGKTDLNGMIELPSAMAAGKVVATIVAGQTTDADTVGFVGKSYQMVANISAETPNVVTPFTTLDVLDTTRTMTDIAAELNLPESVLSGDYVASEDVAKAHVHALARGIVTQLATNKDTNDVSTLYTQTTAINKYINTELGNANVDLNTVNIVMNSGVITHNKLVRQLSDFLESGEVFMASLDVGFYAKEGVIKASFSNGQVTTNNFTQSYVIEGDKLRMTSDGRTGTDQYIYTSEDFALSIPLADKDLIISSHTDFGQEVSKWNKIDLIGQTVYLLFDDAGSAVSETRRTITKLVFSDSTVEITEEGKSFEMPWKINVDGSLEIDGVSTGFAERKITFTKLISDQNITLLSDLIGGRPLTLMLKDESLAQTIFDKWSNI